MPSPLNLAVAPGTGRLIFADDLDAVLTAEFPVAPQYALVSSLDSIALLRRDVSMLLSPGDKVRLAEGRRSCLRMRFWTGSPHGAVGVRPGGGVHRLAIVRRAGSRVARCPLL